MDKKLVDLLVCPICKGPLVHLKEKKELLCRFDRLSYPIRNDIPVMLEDEARDVPSEELEKYA